MKAEDKQRYLLRAGPQNPTTNTVLHLTWGWIRSRRRDIGNLLCFMTTLYGSFITLSISSWNFCNDACLITRVFPISQIKILPFNKELVLPLPSSSHWRGEGKMIGHSELLKCLHIQPLLCHLWKGGNGPLLYSHTRNSPTNSDT